MGFSDVRDPRLDTHQATHPPNHPTPPRPTARPPVLDLQQVADERVGGQRLHEAALGAQEGGRPRHKLGRQVIPQAARRGGSCEAREGGGAGGEGEERGKAGQGARGGGGTS